MAEDTAAVKIKVKMELKKIDEATGDVVETIVQEYEYPLHGGNEHGTDDCIQESAR